MLICPFDAAAAICPDRAPPGPMRPGITRDQISSGAPLGGSRSNPAMRVRPVQSRASLASWLRQTRIASGAGDAVPVGDLGAVPAGGTGGNRPGRAGAPRPGGGVSHRLCGDGAGLFPRADRLVLGGAPYRRVAGQLGHHALAGPDHGPGGGVPGRPDRPLPDRRAGGRGGLHLRPHPGQPAQGLGGGASKGGTCSTLQGIAKATGRFTPCAMPSAAPGSCPTGCGGFRCPSSGSRPAP